MNIRDALAQGNACAAVQVVPIDEFERMRETIRALSERVAQQADLLGKKAEK